MFRSVIRISLICFIVSIGNAQVSINTDIHSSAAVLHLESLNSQTLEYGGFLLPIVTENQQASIPVSTIDNRDDGLMVFVSDPITGKRCWDIYDGVQYTWRSITCFDCDGDVIYEEDFSSYTLGSGIDGKGNLGDHPGSTPWFITSFSSFGSNSEAIPGLLDDGQDYAKINAAGQFELRDTNGAIRFTTPTIDISGYSSIQISVEIGGSGDFEYLGTHLDDFDCGENANDYLDLEYSLDGGSNFVEVSNFSGLGNANHTIVYDEIGFYNASSGNIIITTVLSGLSAPSLVIRIRAQNWAGDEYITFDNIQVHCN